MYALTSSGFLNPTLFDLCIQNLNKAKSTISVCIITTASIPFKENDKWAQHTKNYLTEKGMRNIQFFDFEFDDISQLINHDIVFISGGNPFHLLYHIKKVKAESTLSQIAKSSKILIGVSAGALALTKGVKYIKEFNSIMNFDKPNSIGLKDFIGLGLQNINLFPHYDLFLQMNPNLENALRNIEQRDNVEITRLNNTDYLFYE